MSRHGGVVGDGLDGPEEPDDGTAWRPPGAHPESEPLFTAPRRRPTMATETVDRRASHRRSILVTSIATLVGVAAGVLSSMLATGPGDTLGLALVAAGVFAGLGAMRLVGVDVEEFSTKDHLYVAFMVFSLWFVTWTILLTTGASL